MTLSFRNSWLTNNGWSRHTWAPWLHKNIPSSRHQHHLKQNSDRKLIRNNQKFQSTIPTMSRPEHSAPPEIFYNEAEAEKYTNNTRMMNIQVWHAQELGNICNKVLMSPSASTICLNLPHLRRKWLSVPLSFCVCPMSHVICLILAVAVVCLGSVLRSRWFSLRTWNTFASLGVILGPQLGWSWHLLCHAGGCQWEGAGGGSCLWRSWGGASVQVFRKILSWKWSDFADTNQQGGSFRWCYQHFSFAMAVQCWQVLP